MNRSDKEYKEFKKEFWEWFDKLPWHRKYSFWYFKEDMAETNFYFSVYAKKEKDNSNI